MSSISSSLDQLIISTEVLGTLLDSPVFAYPAYQLELVLQSFKTAIDLVYKTITKVSITFKDAETAEDCVPFAEQMEKALSMMVQGIQNVIIEVQAGPYLSSLLRSKGQKVLSAVKKLAISLKEKDYGNNNIPVLTGQVWEGCKLLALVPLENKLAALSGIVVILPTIKDAYNELEELKEGQVDNHGDSGGGGEGSEEDDDPLGGLVRLSQEDMVVLPGAINLVKLSFMFIQRIEKIIPMSTNDGNEHQYGIWLSEIVQGVKHISEAVDNLSVGLYPPQSREDIVENFGKLKEVILSNLYILHQNSVSKLENVQKLLELIQVKISESHLI